MSDSKHSARPRKVLVVGAGPVGALTALSLHRRGWDVELWESREDPRGKEKAMTNLRSINLAISSRGLEALRSVDPTLAELFLNEAIPMKGRMIHRTDGVEESQVYDPKHGQCINSISRPLLNLRLLEALPSSIAIRFETRLSRIDFTRRLAWGSAPAKGGVQPGEEDDDGQVGGQSHDGSPKTAGKGKGKGKRENVEDEEATGFDLVVGCDGSWSKVRAEMMRVERLDFSQSFIPHAYIELHMPADPKKPGGYAMDRNHLHIWPRHRFMLIALPNKDGSFTLTLFLPFADLAPLEKTRQAAGRFFKDNFPTAVNVVGEESLVDQFMANPRGNLVTINVTPMCHASHAVLLGDASHSMVPFYGQGLNCGLEDVRILNSYLENHSVSSSTPLSLGETDDQLAKALAAYSTERHADLQAICKLALDNYEEMRSRVLSPLHHLRRHLDSLLSVILPTRPPTAHDLSLTEPFPTPKVKGWLSLYEMVTFRPDVPYSEALRREAWQRGVVKSIGLGLAGAAALGVVGTGLGLWMKFARRTPYLTR